MPEVALVLIGVGVLVGWAFDVTVLKSVSAQFPTMKPNAAAGMILAGVALWVGRSRPTSSARRSVVVILAAGVLSIGAVTTAEYLFGWTPQFDQILFHDTSGSVGTAAPGRMTANAGLVFVLAGLALLVNNLRWGGVRIAQALALAIGVVAMVAVVGYVFSVESLTAFGWATRTPINAAIACLILSVALLRSRPDVGVAARFVSAGPGGRILRRLLIPAIAGPVFIGWFVWRGQRGGLYRAEQTLALVSVATGLCFVTLVWFTAVALDRSSARIEAQRVELAEHEERFGALAASASDAIVSADEQGLILYANPATALMFGYPEGALVGQSLTTLMPDRYRDAHVAGMQRYVSSRTSTVMGTVIELDGLRSDGTEFPLELSLSTWGQSSHTFFTGIIRDVTWKRRQTEAAARLAAHESLLARVVREVAAVPGLDSAFAAFAEIVSGAVPCERASFAVREGDTDVFRVAAVWGSGGPLIPEGARVSVQGARPWELFEAGRAVLVSNTAGPAPSALDEALLAAGVRSYVAVPVLVAGAVTALVNLSSPHPNTFDGAPIALVESAVHEAAGTFNTLLLLERERRVTIRLRELDELKNDFVGMVAHDLRSPMTVIAGFAEALRGSDGTMPEDQRDKLLSRIIVNIHRLSSLVSDVLDVASIESGAMEFVVEPFVVGDAVRATVAEIASVFPTREFEVSVQDGLRPGMGDIARYWRVSTNLLTNALKFSSPGTRIGVTVTGVDDEIQVAVTDHGDGISADQIHRLFEKFSRLPMPGGEPKPPGTGLGLYICKQIVEAQRGKLWVDSTIGVGSTFTFSIPVAGAQE